MDILAYNREAWDREVAGGNKWTVPVTPEEVARARQGDFAIFLTPTRPVPMAWFPPLAGARVLALASGGGQQGPLLAAAGARVTVFDNSPAQLAQDRLVAEREGFEIETVAGDMRDLSAFADASFDLIVHPVSNCFVPEVLPVWREARRVLKAGGRLLAGFANPIVFAVDPDLDARGVAQLKYAIPYSDLDSLSDEERRRYTDKGEPLAFGHTLEDQIGGQLAAGFVLTGMYESAATDADSAIHRLLAGYLATCAVVPA
jgi:SAM-dependent methyltransferase